MALAKDAGVTVGGLVRLAARRILEDSDALLGRGDRAAWQRVTKTTSRLGVSAFALIHRLAFRYRGKLICCCGEIGLKCYGRRVI